MRWSSSSRRGAAGVVALVLAACVTTTTRLFLPSPQNPRYSAAAAQPVLAEYVRLQCAALRQAQRADSGTARFAVDRDSAGTATRAELVRGTGDEMLDGVFGTVAAQLTLPHDAADGTARAGRAGRVDVDIAWRCRETGADVQVRPGAAR